MTFPGVVTRLDVLNPEECSYVIETCKPFVEPSTIETPDSSADVIEEVRRSKSVVIGPDDSRFESIRPLMQRTVEAFVECTQTGFYQEIHHTEAIQFTEYAEGDFYNWHMDSSPTTPRISSASLCLSDYRSFQGGDLSFRDMIDPNEKKPTPLSIKINQGELAVFPSLLVHSVKPITEGTRYSLVLWSPFVHEDQPQNNEQPVLSQGQDPIVF